MHAGTDHAYAVLCGNVIGDLPPVDTGNFCGSSYRQPHRRCRIVADVQLGAYGGFALAEELLGYSPGVAVINDMIVGIENRGGNTNVRFNQKETLERIFKRLEASEIYISRARMDCGSCSEEIVDMVEAHCRYFYIRANRCSSFYDSMFALTGWKTVEINGIEFELNSILVEKWKGKPYRLVIQRQRRIDGYLLPCT